jgi:hypothetical protein
VCTILTCGNWLKRIGLSTCKNVNNSPVIAARSNGQSAALETAWTGTAIAIASVVIPIKHHLAYSDGWRFLRGSEFFLLPFGLLLGACLVVPLLVRWLNKASVYTTWRKWLIGGFSLCVFLSPFVYTLLDHSNLERFLDGMRDRLEKDVDPEALQNWALAELSKLSNIPDRERDDQLEKDFPAFVTRLCAVRPNSWPIILDDTAKPHLNIVWGSGFGHWGILVGDKDFSPPHTEHSTSYRRFMQWRPGIYVFLSGD